MRRATRTAAAWLGVSAGLAGLEHGYYEILQGPVGPAAIMFESMGAPCVPETAWHACEPAMSVIPNFLVTGILALVISLFVVVWSIAFVQRKNGGLVLILLSVALLLFGGGFFPPLIGIVAGVAGTKINKPLARRKPAGPLGIAARLWPWPLVVYLAWVCGQFIVGYFYNDFLQGVMGCGLLLILTMLPLSIYSAYAHDAVEQGG